MKRDVSPAAFWAIAVGMALAIVAAAWFFSVPNMGKRAPAGAPPPTPQSAAKGPPPPPPSGFPRHGE